MTRTLTLLTSLAIALGFAAPVHAQADPADIAARCVAAIQDTMEQAARDMHATTDRTTARIRQLDADGASDERIVAAGRAGVQAVTDTEVAAVREIRQLRNNTIQALRRLDAPRQLIARVSGAARAGAGKVEDAAERATTQIHTAVRAAIR